LSLLSQKILTIELLKTLIQINLSLAAKMCRENHVMPGKCCPKTPSRSVSLRLLGPTIYTFLAGGGLKIKAFLENFIRMGIFTYKYSHEELKVPGGPLKKSSVASGRHAQTSFGRDKHRQASLDGGTRDRRRGFSTAL